MDSEFDYEAYLASGHWAELRDHALHLACHACQVCNSPHDLVVHHRTYERIGNEDIADLTVLCSECHDLFHAGGRVLGLHLEQVPHGVVV